MVQFSGKRGCGARLCICTATGGTDEAGIEKQSAGALLNSFRHQALEGIEREKNLLFIANPA
jgi:hypothetical protein